MSRDAIGENGDLNLYAFVEDNPVDFQDLYGLTRVIKDAQSITQDDAMSGIWGWTTLESESQRAAKTKMKGCLCKVIRKPEMIFTILVKTAHSGKQSWTESATVDGVNYPDVSVYIGSGLANFSRQHEEKRYQAWRRALTSFWPSHYEDPAAALTAPTCPELQAKIAELYQRAVADWQSSALPQLYQVLLEIGKESVNPNRWVRKSGFGSVSVVYDTN